MDVPKSKGQISKSRYEWHLSYLNSCQSSPTLIAHQHFCQIPDFVAYIWQQGLPRMSGELLIPFKGRGSKTESLWPSLLRWGASCLEHTQYQTKLISIL